VMRWRSRARRSVSVIAPVLLATLLLFPATPSGHDEKWSTSRLSPSMSSSMVGLGSGWSVAPAPVLVSFSYPPASTCGDSVNVTFTSNVTGGRPPYSYSWDFGDRSPLSRDPNPTHEFTSAWFGATINLTVTDGAGGIGRHSAPLRINFLPCATRSQGFPPPILFSPAFLIAGLAIACFGAGLTGALILRPGRRPRPAPRT
jgi:hypothetical protein